jgi:hypothetical protein
MHRVRADVTGKHWFWFYGWLRFRLPAHPLHIPPRIARCVYSCDLDYVIQILRVGADRRDLPRSPIAIEYAMNTTRGGHYGNDFVWNET